MQGPVEESGHEVRDIMVCDVCADPGREYLLVICSRCSDGAEHTYCMGKIMDKVPSEDWQCEECRSDVQIKGRKTDDIEASTKMLSFGQAGSGSSSLNKKALAVSDDENRVGIGSAAKILGKRQSEVIEVFQGSMPPPFKRSSDMQGERGISAGSIGSLQIASESRTPEWTSISSGGREEKGPRDIPDLNSSLVDDDFTFSIPVAVEKVKRSYKLSTPNLNGPPGSGDVTFSGEWQLFPVADGIVKRIGESSAPHFELSVSAGKDELDLNLEAQEAAATKGGEDEISLSLALPSQTASKGGEDELSLSLSLPIPDKGLPTLHSSLL